MKQDLISLHAWSKKTIAMLFDKAAAMKSGAFADKPLQGKTVALIFTKPSNRTRVSFEVGVVNLGGYPVYLGPKELQLGQREAVKDVAKVLSRYVDGIVIRTFAHEDVAALSKHADVPVINGLCDLYHPCQILADMFTLHEKSNLFGKKIVYMGDGNNILHSWLCGAAIMGLEFVFSTPPNYTPNPDIVAQAQQMASDSGARLIYESDPVRAVADADVLYADVWLSMGQEEDIEKAQAFSAYQVNGTLLAYAKPSCLFMHCLPAHRGQEVTNDVMDSPHSIVYDQAENRLHIQKAVLCKLLSP